MFLESLILLLATLITSAVTKYEYGYSISKFNRLTKLASFVTSAVPL